MAKKDSLAENRGRIQKELLRGLDMTPSKLQMKEKTIKNFLGAYSIVKRHEGGYAGKTLKVDHSNIKHT